MTVVYLPLTLVTVSRDISKVGQFVNRAQGIFSMSMLSGNALSWAWYVIALAVLTTITLIVSFVERVRDIFFGA